MLAVDVDEVDTLGPARPGLRGVLLDLADHRRHTGSLEVGAELLARGQPAEQPAFHERVDRDHLATRREGHLAEQDGRATLVAADLQQAGPWSGRGGLVEQQPALVLGEPAGHGVRQGPGELEVGPPSGRPSEEPAGEGSGAGIVARQGVGAPRNRGYTHARHSTGSRGSVIATSEATVTRPPRPEHARQAVARTLAEIVVGTLGLRVGGARHLRVAGGHGVPAAPRRDDVRHEVRPHLRRRALPRPEPVAVEAGLELRGAAEPGLRLPVPPGRVLPAGRQPRGARLGRAARLDGTPPGRRLRGGASPVAGPATGGLAVVGVGGRHRVRHRTASPGPGRRAERGDPPDGRAALGRAADRARAARAIGVRAGALWSGVALLFIGGVNAVENLAALPLPLFVVLSTLAPPRWRAAGALVAGRRRPRQRLVDAAAAGPRPLQPAVPRLHRDLRGRGAPAGLDQRRSRRRPLGLLRVRRRRPVVARLLRAVHRPAAHRGDRGGGRGRSLGADPGPDAPAPAVAAEPAARA